MHGTTSGRFSAGASAAPFPADGTGARRTAGGVGVIAAARRARRLDPLRAAAGLVLLALAAVAGLPGTAQAQDIVVWSATMTVGIPAPPMNPINPAPDGYCGDNGSGKCVFRPTRLDAFGALSDTDFMHDGTTYTVQSLRSSDTGDLWLTLDTQLPQAAKNSLVLTLNGRTFALSSAEFRSGGQETSQGNGYRWDLDDDDRAWAREAGNGVRVMLLDGGEVLDGLVSVPPIVTVPHDWALKPAGLGEGDRFRLLFLTSGKRSAISKSIREYNTFVALSAASGHEAIRPYASGFRAVASTLGTSARENTGTDKGAGVSIYWLGGHDCSGGRGVVAPTNNAFYDGFWGYADNPDIDCDNPDNDPVHPQFGNRVVTNENGDPVSIPPGTTTEPGGLIVWTGSKDDGTVRTAYGTEWAYALGDYFWQCEWQYGCLPGHAGVGNLVQYWHGQAPHNPLSGGVRHVGDSYPLYALSQVFVVAAPGEPGGTVVPNFTPPLKVQIEKRPQTHDGETAFTFILKFNQRLKNQALGSKVVRITGGTHDGSLRLRGNEERWAFRVKPSGGGDVTVLLAESETCESGIACTEGDERPLSAELSFTVEGPGVEDRGVSGSSDAPVEPLRAWFGGVPDHHDGSTAFTFRVLFNYKLKNQKLGGKVVRVTGGTNTNSRRVGVNSEIWQITVTPSGNDDITISLAASDTCGNGIACTEGDRRPLSAGIQHKVKGPPKVSVADASATEGEDAHMAFTVKLSRNAPFPVSVDYATEDGTATSPADYTATSGTLSFSVGQRSKTVRVPIVDDTHDDDGETFTFVLSNPSAAVIKDGTATGTIRNNDAMPRAWLARFGRTVAGQVLEAVESRMQAPRTPGAEASVAGRRLGLGPLFGADGEAGEQTPAATLAAARLTDWLDGETGPAQGHGSPARALTERDLVLGSSFAFTAAAEAGTVSLWGRGAVARFDGREGRMTLDGEVASGLLGADWSWGPGSGAGAGNTTAGLIVGHSRGDGGYRAAAGGGTVASTLTGVYPWARHAFSERLSAWGVAGYGEGALTLTPEGPDGGSRAALRSDLGLAMGAAGVRGVLLAAPAGGGPALAVKADALGVRTTSATVPGLAAADADVTRLRLGLEGAWAVRLEGGGTLTPTLEVGVRHDGGDAETGAGADLGGGLAWSDPERGLSAELRGRGLLAHAADGFRERGLSGTLSFDPTPGTERGLALTLSRTVGAAATGGMDALLGRGTMADLVGAAHGDDLASRRLEVRLGYGLAASGRFASTPEAALARSDGHREYSLGWRLTLAGRGAGALELRLEATRREPAHGQVPGAGPEHGVGVRAAARW